MGRKSKAKRERREHGVGQIAAVAKGRTRQELLALVEAASASPTASHRIPSLAMIFDAVIRRTKPGPHHVTPSLLPDLVEAAQAEGPWLASQEDFEPCDPRLAVQVRWRGELFRLIPGVSTHPVAKIDLWEWLAETIDPVLVPAIGYGLGDLVEIALRRMSHVASELSKVWPEGEMSGRDTPPSIHAAELTAANALRPLRDQIAACSDPSRAMQAVMAHSVPPRQLRHGPRTPASFGEIIAIREGPEKFQSIPAALLSVSVGEAAAQLARKALTLKGDVLEPWRGSTTGRLCAFLEGAGQPICGLISLEGVPRVLPLLRYGPRQWVAMDVVAELDGGSLDDALASSRDALAQVMPERTLSTSGGPIGIPDDATIAKVQVIAVPRLPDHLGIQAGGPRPMPLQDVLHIARAAAKEPTDLWYYLSDLDAPTRPKIVALGEIGAWEAWRNNGKTLWPSAHQVESIFIADDGVEQEWAAAHSKFNVEQSLLALEMPPARDWPAIDIEDDGVILADRRQQLFCAVFPWEIPVAIIEDYTSADQSAASLLHNMASGMGFVLQRTRTAVVDTLADSGIKALRIDFCHDPLPDAPPLEIDFAPPVLRVTWGLSLGDSLQDDNHFLQSRIGEAIAECLPGLHKEQFESAWADAPPAIGFGTISVAQRRTELPAPIGVHQWHQTRWIKALSAYLLAEEVEAGTYTGEAAKRLLNETVYPWLIGKLQEQLALYDRQELLEYAITQLEHLHCQRWRMGKDLSLMTGFSDYNEANVEKLRKERRESFELSKMVAVLVDELIASPSHGEKPVDSLAWRDMLSLAELCLMSCLSSEMSHQGIGGLQVEMLESGELVFTPEDSERADIASFQAAVATSDGTESVSRLLNRIEPPDDARNAPESIVSVIPELEPAQASLKEELGFTLDALIGVFDAVEKWEIPHGQVFASASAREIAEAAVRLHGVASIDEYEKAVMWLARTANDTAADSESEIPIKHWEIERRAERIDTRPIVQWGNTLYVLPWTASNAWKIMLNYLGDARLPWPEEMIGPNTAKALDSIRQKRNRELERECAQAVAHPLLEVRPNVCTNKAKALGIEKLSGEIDTLVIDPRSGRIWVIEVKDPHFPYSPRSMASEIHKFHKPKGYVEMLRHKIAEIGQYASAIAARLNLPSPNRQWDVRGLFVTRRATPSAFADCVDMDFCTIEEVRALVVEHDELAADQTSNPGLNPDG